MTVREAIRKTFDFTTPNDTIIQPVKKQYFKRNKILNLPRAHSMMIGRLMIGGLNDDDDDEDDVDESED